MAQIPQPANETVSPYVVYFPVDNCQACKVSTSDLYSRTIDGKKYCIDCLNKGAGVDEYIGTSLEVMVGEELKELARKNGFL